jgi:hypothetical protein
MEPGSDDERAEKSALCRLSNRYFGDNRIIETKEKFGMKRLYGHVNVPSIDAPAWAAKTACC